MSGSSRGGGQGGEEEGIGRTQWVFRGSSSLHDAAVVETHVTMSLTNYRMYNPKVMPGVNYGL